MPIKQKSWDTIIDNTNIDIPSPSRRHIEFADKIREICECPQRSNEEKINHIQQLLEN